MAKLEPNDIEEIEKLVQNKLIDKRVHPSGQLILYNYSKSCEQKHKWNQYTEMCRGLICDINGNIVARPFKKFFNLEELKDPSVIPNLPFVAYDKLDGSLGILYWFNDAPFIATRGAFESPQAKHATKILLKQYGNYIGELDRKKTYLFEIISPEDAHIIKYSGVDDIFLIGVIDIETGEEDEITNWTRIFKIPKIFDGCDDYKKIREVFSGENREGFVIKFANNYRLKMKYESYFKLFNASKDRNRNEKSIFLQYTSGKNPYEDLSIFEEEVAIYIKECIAKFEEKYAQIEKEYKELYQQSANCPNEKAVIDFFKKCKNPSILFSMKKGADYSKKIWEIVKNELFSKEEGNKKGGK